MSMRGKAKGGADGVSSAAASGTSYLTNLAGSSASPPPSSSTVQERISTAAGSQSRAAAATDASKAASVEKQKVLLSSTSGHFTLVRALHLADLITLGNGFSGVMSIFSSLRYALQQTPPAPSSSSLASGATTFTPADTTQIWLALLFIPLGLIFDFLDGKVARWRGKSSLMGQELDSLADLISFGVAPAVAAFALGLRTPLDSLALCFFVLCGLTRLARFNVTVSALPKDATGKSRYFEGFPIPTSLIIVGAMATCVFMGHFTGGTASLLDGGKASKAAAAIAAVPGTVPFGIFDLSTRSLLDTSLSGSIVAGAAASGAISARLTRGGVDDYAAVHPVALIFVVWGCLMVSKTLHIPKP